MGNGELTVVATYDLGAQGVQTSDPVVFPWRWNYHLWSLASWTLALVPLVLIRENRRRGAWTILLALVAILLGTRMAAALLMFQPATTERIGTFFGTLATGWTIVWLLWPWFVRMRGWQVLLVSATGMLGIQALSYVSDFGLTYDDSLANWAILYAMATFVLLSSMTLSRRSCRKTYSSVRFMVWLFLWTLVVAIVVMFTFCAIVVIGLNQEELSDLLHMLIPALLYGTIGGLLLYLFNLPFMLVSMRMPFYRRRFRRVFGLRGRLRRKAAGALESA